jgi:hypothetical protein
MRKTERFASGQPRHWDLVAEVRASDLASAERISGASLLPSRNPFYPGLGTGLGSTNNYRSRDGHVSYARVLVLWSNSINGSCTQMRAHV